MLLRQTYVAGNNKTYVGHHVKCPMLHWYKEIFLVKDQRDGQFFSMYLLIFLTFYMFRAHRAHHQERQIVSIQPLVAVGGRVVCKSPTCKRQGTRPPTQSDSYQRLYWHNLSLLMMSTMCSKHVKVKVKVTPQQAEVAQGVPGRLRPRIFLTFGTTRVVGHQPYAPAAFTPGEIPGTHFQRLSRPLGTWFRRELRKKSPVTPPGIDPGTSRLVAQCARNM